MALAVNEFFMV